jgi:hypothetical protein
MCIHMEMEFSHLVLFCLPTFAGRVLKRQVFYARVENMMKQDRQTGEAPLVVQFSAPG